MNINIIKDELKNNIGRRVLVTVYGMRNKIDRYEGNILNTYPNIFTIMYEGREKSFTYREILTKDVKIKYL